MLRRSRTRIGVAALVLAAALAGTAVAAATTSSAKAPALPSPKDFVSNLDLECFRTSAYTPPPLHSPLTLSHLNPVLAGLPRWTVETLGPRTQLCSPVAKNDVLPPKEVLEFVRYVDLSCYRISGPAVGFPLTLSHLNPQLAHLPRRQVTVVSPEQLCVPVIKNDSVPPDEVLRLVRYVDLVCYRETPQASLGLSLLLTQLNPVLADIPPTKVDVTPNRQLCVPVRKNNQDIPDDVLKIVQWVDLEKFDVVAPAMHQIDLKLRHINPLLADLPAEPATLVSRHQLALPVAKNGNTPG
ncbi:hypothetical protein [Actinophytocola oryzae]|uniref:Uncharacterized protein n=1 Tax=Actinophytocola oryzae TaxID=502181 RepID=A0A4R7V2J1_9PSEU|nr:hypothetical protein [Actinophytocola oryzae]TDV43563.1 hypothetical protein CLV71_11525 [Actinophytocola oryzae]